MAIIQYYTDYKYEPVQSIAKSSVTGHPKTSLPDYQFALNQQDFQ